MPPKPISTYDDEEIKRHISEKLKKPWQFPAILSGIDPSIGLPIGSYASFRIALKALIGGIAIKRRFRYAAWRWLQHSTALGDCTSIQKDAGLDHLDKITYFTGLSEACKEIIDKHSSLELWVERRLALLEYLSSPPSKVPKDLIESCYGYRYALTEAIIRKEENAVSARNTAYKVAAGSLELAARATCHILGKREQGCRVRANLMVPVQPQEIHNYNFISNEPARTNCEKGREVWADCRGIEKCLLVVAETDQAEHLGFWVPVIRGANVFIPGATHALLQSEGSAVFQDDLPSIKGLGDAVDRKWQAYMIDSFKEKLFVSIPFRLPTPIKDKSPTVAVLNVNVTPPTDDRWRRAYHREWLDTVTESVSPFLNLAFEAHLLESHILGANHYPRLDTGEPMWNKLPGTVRSGNLNLIEEGTNESR